MLPIAMKWWNQQRTSRKSPAPSRFAPLLWLVALSCPLFNALAEKPGAVTFKETVQPLLAKYCYDCHGDGMNKGKVAFDEFKTHEEMVGKRDLWWAALKNLRAGIMPPEKKPRPTPAEQAQFETWIKSEIFGTDPANPDPGRVTIRRLNRVEYRNTIRDLMGTDFKADDEFPPDDTGYGFDNIGDVLTVSPLLLEKYMQAAETIVGTAVPTVRKVVQEQSIPGAEFRMAGIKESGERLSFFKPASVSNSFKVDQPGDYRIAMDIDVARAFDFDPGRCRVAIKLDERELSTQEFGSSSNKLHFDFSEKWQAGPHQLSFNLEPIALPEKPAGSEKPEETPATDATKADAGTKAGQDQKKGPNGKQGEPKRNPLDLKIISVKIQGPLDKRFWVAPKNFARFFPKPEPPSARAAQRDYARAILARFTEKAFRRPVDDRTIDRLVAIAENGYTQPGKVFEEGVGQAMVAVLASPRFLFRVEETESGLSTKSYPLVDEYALASRLSYFLWSTMPDQELFALAGGHKLRKQFAPQVKRMLADKRSDGVIRNFTGQWLQVRDVEGIAINERMVLARDAGEEKELQRELEQFRARFANRQSRTNRDQRTGQFKRPRLFEKAKVELDGELRRAMQAETELTFGYIARENRSVLELLDSDYTFANEKLAHHYGLSDVKGTEMRRVRLPKDSPRGGLLTEGTVLLVTSNPTRTSPVKRGLFILDNVLGIPTPPPPPDVPLLEESEKAFKDHEPTLREILEVHRSKPLCSSCHSRMDPLGLALENFNAMGMWREKERAQAIDPVGKLITGETFHDIRELKHILKDKRPLDFYRCLTEKFLTYALGRGLEYYDVETVDQIVARLEETNGQFSALLMGIVESAPFQKRRDVSTVTAQARVESSKGEAVNLQP